MPSLFDPLKVGALTLPNRVLLAPLTRLRAGATSTPHARLAQYYATRAAARSINCVDPGTFARSNSSKNR